MKLTVETVALKAALVQVGKVVQAKSTLPALTHILIEAHVDGGVTITGTDLESRAMRTIGATVEAEGQTLLPGKMLASFVSELGDGETTITLKGKRATISSGRAEITLPGLDPETFPPAGDFDAPSVDLTMAADVFAGALSGVLHAVHPDDARPALAGVLLRVQANTLTLWAVDGFRIAARYVHDLPDAPEFEAIVSGKPLRSLVGSLSTATSARLMVNERASDLLIESDIGSWQVRLIDGQFPDLTRIIPRDCPMAFIANRASLLAAVKLVGPVAVESSQVTRLSLADGTLTVKAVSQNEVAETSVTVDTVRGGDLAWAVNNRYLRDALEALDTESVEWEISTDKSPSALHTGDRTVGIQVVMPMHDNR